MRYCDAANCSTWSRHRILTRVAPCSYCVVVVAAVTVACRYCCYYYYCCRCCCCTTVAAQSFSIGDHLRQSRQPRRPRPLPSQSAGRASSTRHHPPGPSCQMRTPTWRTSSCVGLENIPLVNVLGCGGGREIYRWFNEGNVCQMTDSRRTARDYRLCISHPQIYTSRQGSSKLHSGDDDDKTR